MDQNESDLVLFEEVSVREGLVGKITLNQSKKLNALSTVMYELILQQIDLWEERKDILWLWIDSSLAKAFSSGGDVKSLALGLFNGDLTAAKDFFTKEYFVDYRLHKYSKPRVVFGDGYVFGGGWGLFQACSHRVATENSQFSMPEISIGLFPDVGASYYFSGLPENLALFLSLTGARLNGAEACEFKLADALVEAASKEKLFKALCDCAISQSQNLEQRAESIQSVIDRIQSKTLAENLFVKNKYPLIQKLKLAEGFDSAHESLLENKNDAVLGLDISRYLAGSEDSQRVIYELMKNYRTQDLKEAFLRDWHLALKFCKAGGFKEGVRALLIDKDNKPQWPKYKGNIENYFIQNEGDSLELLMDLSS